jgi:putative heme degradation protein
METASHTPWIPADPPSAWYQGPGQAPTDLEALQARPDLQLLPLHRDTPEILDFLPNLGPLVLITRTAGVECATWSAGLAVQQDLAATVLWARSGALCRIGPGWRHSVLALDRSAQERPPSLMLFGPWGDLLLQVSLTGDSRMEGLQALVQAHRGCGHCLRLEPRPGPDLRVPGAWSGGMLRQAWSEAGSPGDLDARLVGLGLTPLLAVRAMEGLFTTPVAPHPLATLLDRLGHRRIPLHLECGDRHGAQAWSGPLAGLARATGHWILRFPEAQVRLALETCPEVWSVIRPGASGGRPRLEGFDGSGRQVLALAPQAGTSAEWEHLLPVPGWD